MPLHETAAGLSREAAAWERVFAEPNGNIVVVQIGKGD
jgi:hypothetical protein